MFRFGQRLSQIMGKGAVPLTPEEVSLLDHYDLELEDALSTGGSFPNSWLNVSGNQYIFVDNAQQFPGWTQQSRSGTDLAVDGSDATVINILTNGYYLIDYSTRLSNQTAPFTTSLAIYSTSVEPSLAGTDSVAYLAGGAIQIAVPAGLPQNSALWENYSFGPFKAAVGDTIGGAMQLVAGTVGDNFVFDANLSIIRVA